MRSLTRQAGGDKPAPERAVLLDRGEVSWSLGPLAADLVDAVVHGGVSRHGETNVSDRGLLDLLRGSGWTDIEMHHVKYRLRVLRRFGLQRAWWDDPARVELAGAEPSRIRDVDGNWRCLRRLVPAEVQDDPVHVCRVEWVYPRRFPRAHGFGYVVSPEIAMLVRQRGKHGGARPGAGRPCRPCDGCGLRSGGRVREVKVDGEVRCLCRNCRQARRWARLAELRPGARRANSSSTHRKAVSTLLVSRLPSEDSSHARCARGNFFGEKREQAEEAPTSHLARGDSPDSGLEKNGAARPSGPGPRGPKGAERAIAAGEVVRIASQRRTVFRAAMPGVDLDRLVVLAVADTPTGTKLRVRYSDGTTGEVYRHEVSAGRSSGPRARETRQACRMLRGLLARGPQPVEAVRAEAADWELSWWAVKAAKKKLGIRTRWQGRTPYWRMP